MYIPFCNFGRSYDFTLNCFHCFLQKMQKQNNWSWEFVLESNIYVLSFVYLYAFACMSGVLACFWIWDFLMWNCWHLFCHVLLIIPTLADIYTVYELIFSHSVALKCLSLLFLLDCTIEARTWWCLNNGRCLSYRIWWPAVSESKSHPAYDWDVHRPKWPVSWTMWQARITS